MAIGFVLIKTDPGREKEVYQGLVRAKGVEELFPLFGEFDLIVKVKAKDFDELGRLIVAGIRSIPGVRNTYTLTATKL